MIKHSLINAWRILKRQRFYTILNLIGLSFSMMSFLVISLYIWHDWSFDKFHQQGDRIYRLWGETNGRRFAVTPYAWADQLIEDFAEIEEITRVQVINGIFKVGDKIFPEKKGIAVDSSFFRLFDFELKGGDKEEVLRDPNGLLITPEMATKYFGAADPIEQHIEINLFGNTESFMVQGIIHCVSNSHLQFDYVLPFERVIVNNPNKQGYTNWSMHFLYTYMLFRENTSLEGFRDRLNQFLYKHKGERLSNKYTPGIERLDDIYLKSHYKLDMPVKGDLGNLKILSIVALAILGIGLINFVNLTTARAFTRAHNISIRKVYGSQRWILIVQFMIESWMVLLAAMLMALLWMQLLNSPICAITGKELAPSNWMNINVLSILIAFWFIIGAAVGLYPGWIISAFQPIDLLRSRYYKSGSQIIARKVLSIFQIACASALIIGTLVMWYQVEYMHNKALGFEKEQLVIIEDGGLVSSHNQQLERLRLALQSAPFFKSVSALSSYPGSVGHWSSRYTWDGSDQTSSTSILTFFSDFHFVETLGLKMIAGRDFSPTRKADSTNFIINEACLALFAQEDTNWLYDPFAQDLIWRFKQKKGKVIGVVEDFHFESLKNEIAPIIIHTYTPWTAYIGIKIKTKNYTEAIDKIEINWNELFPDIPFTYQFADEAFDASFRSERKIGQIFMVFAGVSILVAMLGLLGLAASMAHEKSKEIGIRKVVGASRINLVVLLIRQFAVVIIIANLIAIPFAYWGTNEWLQDFIFRIDWPISVIFITFMISMLVTIGTVMFHTLRVSAINPSEVLASE